MPDSDRSFRRRAGGPPDGRADLRAGPRPESREPRFDQRLDQWLATGRQLVDGVAGARPGSRTSGRPQPGGRAGGCRARAAWAAGWKRSSIGCWKTTTAGVSPGRGPPREAVAARASRPGAHRGPGPAPLVGPAPPPSRLSSGTTPGPGGQPRPPSTLAPTRIPGPPAPAAPPAARVPPARPQARRLAPTLGQRPPWRPVSRPLRTGAKTSRRPTELAVASHPNPSPPNPRNAAPSRPSPGGLPPCCRPVPRGASGPSRWGRGPRIGPMTPASRWTAGSGQPVRIARPQPRCPCSPRSGRLGKVLPKPASPLPRRASPGDRAPWRLHQRGRPWLHRRPGPAPGGRYPGQPAGARAPSPAETGSAPGRRLGFDGPGGLGWPGTELVQGRAGLAPSWPRVRRRCCG